jgi:hypothetical protein
VTNNPLTGDFTWNIVGDFGGCVACTMLIMRALAHAEIRWIDRMPSIVEAYVIGTLLLLAADIFLPPLPTASSIALCVVNGFGVALTAIGGSAVFGVPTKPPGAKQ